MMNLEDYQAVFMAAASILVLLAASPALSMVIQIPSTSQPFSQLWVLGSDRKIGDYPFNVTVNQPFEVFVGVGNHMQVSSYYMVYLKFRNQTQPLPSSNESEPSPLPSIFEFRFLLVDGENLETPLNLTLQEFHIGEKSFVVNRISVNGTLFNVNYPSSEPVYQVFFELWRYNATVDAFQYSNRFVDVWLNIVD